MSRKRFVILDRDGTVIVERHYLSSPEGVELVPNAAAGLRHFEELGWGRLVVTNQSGIDRGFFDLPRVLEIHARLESLLAECGASVDGFYICPHTPEYNCACRKPKIGLIEKAAAEWDFDAAKCIVIGDKTCDIEMGRALGATTILVRSGYGEEHLRNGWARPDFVVHDLKEAADLAGNADAFSPVTRIQSS